MGRIVPESELPSELTAASSVEAAYPDALERCREALRRGLPVLVECDRELAPVFARVLGARLEADGRRPVAVETVAALREAVRQPGGGRVLFLPHLDLLTTPKGTLAPEAREVVPLLYENADTPWIGFTDPGSRLPRAAADLFARREVLLGVARDRLARLVTRDEARHLGGLDPLDLGRRVSGVNAVRLRRLLAAIAGDARPLAALREATLGGLTVPDVDLDADIGGYAGVKERLRRDLLDVAARRAAAADLDEARRIEELLPRGLILWGPPGTGKSTFARAVARAMEAALATIPGPELRARWAEEGEETLRRTFVRAREAAPAVILVEGLDAFSPRRGAEPGAVEPSMQSALLAEIDALRREEHVLVIATSSVVEAVDPALLRPGRFELDLFVGLPDASDRRAILELLSRRFGLELAGAALDYAVERSGDPVLAGGAPMSGDHLQAMARALARGRLREGTVGPTASAQVEQVITEIVGRAGLAGEEAELHAVHEAGHALVALILGRRVDRLGLAGDLGGAIAGSAAAAIRRGSVSQAWLQDSVCILLAGREAEDELLGDLSGLGARDLARASALARTMCWELGMGPSLFPDGSGESIRAGVDFAVRDLLKIEQERSRQLLEEQREALVALTRALVTREVLDGAALAELVKFEEPAPPTPEG
jgi:cell division protease FtsH